MKTTAFLLTMLLPAVASSQPKSTTGTAPVNGLKMYYEVHGSGEPVVLLLRYEKGYQWEFSMQTMTAILKTAC